MSDYVPDQVYGLIPGSYREYGGPRYGLHPLPAHLQPREGSVELTKKGEAYVAAALAEAGSIFFLAFDQRDRTSIATVIERLINLLDDLDGDPNLEDGADSEPWLGWSERNQQVGRDLGSCDDREDENKHGREDSLDGGRTEHGIALHDFRTMWSIAP